MAARLRHLLLASWLRRGWLAWALLPLSGLAWLWLRLRHLTRRMLGIQAVQLPVPVIVVGNVIAGGAGKTPVVMALVEHFTRQGLHTGVISRGYGRRSSGVQEVGPGDFSHEVGDEPLLIRQRCGIPVFVGRDRVAAARALLHAYPHTQLLISDDGLQHAALGHDVAVCVFDERGLGNGWLLPAGPLREAWPRPVDHRAAQFTLLSQPCPTLGGYELDRYLSPWVRNGHQQIRPLSEWQHTDVQALAGIAKPQAFFDMLQQQGLRITRAHALPDHADLRAWELQDTQTPVFCTEKDAVKLWARYPQIWAVPLECHLPQAFVQELDRVIDEKLSSRHGQQTT